MAEVKAHYIVTVGGGKCLDNTQTAHGVVDRIPQHSKSQQWIIEPSEEDPNVVAFKSCVDDQYLRNNGPTQINWGAIGMGEKQWWTLEKGKNPGSTLIRSNACTIGASYLNDFEGLYRDYNKVHMWQMVEQRQFWLDWYFIDADNAPFNPVASTASSKAGAQRLKAREEELASREQRLKDAEQKAKPLEEREAALKKKEQLFAEQEKAINKKADALSTGAQKAVEKANPPEGASKHAIELLKAENEKLELQLKVKELEQAQRTAIARVPANGRRAIEFNCGHKAYPPPRKLERKIVGIMYE